MATGESGPERKVSQASSSPVLTTGSLDTTVHPQPPLAGVSETVLNGPQTAPLKVWFHSPQSRLTLQVNWVCACAR